MLIIQEQLEKIRTSKDRLPKLIDELEKKFLAREPKVESFIPENGRFDRIRDDANRLQKEYTQFEVRPPLYGLLVGVKDIFHVDGFPTQAGTKIPADELKGPEAIIITKLKQKGVIIFGKTVTTEFAYFAPGPTRNPHNPEHTPGGSSSGSAAAVAAGFVPLALGTQTIGSVIRPASYCGVFGFKPTYGRIPTEGVIPLSPSVDTIGFFTENAMNAEFLSRFIIDDWQTSSLITDKPVLGIPCGPYMGNIEPEMGIFFVEISQKLQSSGYSIYEVPAMENFDHIYKHHNNLVAYEAAKIHKLWYEKYPHLYHSKTVELIIRGQGIKEDEYKDALKSRLILRRNLQSLQNQWGIDLWLSPPAQGAAPKGLDSTGNPIMNLPWSHCGFPTINLPVGHNQAGLPMGLQITAGMNKDEALLNWVINFSTVLGGDYSTRT